MTSIDLDALDRKYRKFMPLPSAVEIIRLIEHSRKLEEFRDSVNRWADEMVKELTKVEGINMGEDVNMVAWQEIQLQKAEKFISVLQNEHKALQNKYKELEKNLESKAKDVIRLFKNNQELEKKVEKVKQLSENSMLNSGDDFKDDGYSLAMRRIDEVLTSEESVVPGTS